MCTLTTSLANIKRIRQTLANYEVKCLEILHVHNDIKNVYLLNKLGHLCRRDGIVQEKPWETLTFRLAVQLPNTIQEIHPSNWPKLTMGRFMIHEKFSLPTVEVSRGANITSLNWQSRPWTFAFAKEMSDMLLFWHFNLCAHAMTYSNWFKKKMQS